MDFDYYFKKYDEEYGFNDSELCGFRIGFVAGQQSKQAQINKVLELLRQPIQGTVADLLSELEDILDDTWTNAKDCG